MALFMIQCALMNSFERHDFLSSVGRAGDLLTLLLSMQKLVAGCFPWMKLISLGAI